MSDAARRADRARRTGAAVDDAIRTGQAWVWPHWLERQLDHGSGSFVPRTGGPLENVSGRGWTAIGNVGSPVTATVDRRGLVTPWPDGWSLDWWVGAEDRWHLPSREAAVRQRLIDDSPVVETAMRVPGGDILHRAFVVRSAPVDGGEELVVVEVENATPVPVALAIAVRPYGHDGVADVRRIELRDGGGRDGGGAGTGARGGTAGGPVGERSVVLVDGRAAILLPRAPNRSAGARGADGDVASTVFAGTADDSFPDEVVCEAGLATAAFVYPLPHRATISFVLPLAPPPSAATRGRRSAVRPLPRRPAGLPVATQVANGWRAHAARGMRLVLPDARLASAVEASRRALLVGIGEDPAELLALDRYGHPAEVAESIGALAARQAGDGSFDGRRATGGAIAMIEEHWRLHRDAGALAGSAPVVGAAAEWLVRAGGSRRRGGAAPVAGPSDLWRARGLLAAATVLRAVGEGAGADDAAAAAERLRPAVATVVAAAAARTGAPDPGALAACWPHRLLTAADASLASLADAVRDRGCHGPAVTVPAGLSPALTLALAATELASSDRLALDRLEWVLAAATPTWTWPEAVHPRLDGGSGGPGQHRPTTGSFLSFVRDLLVREEPGGGLALCSVVPWSWLGQQLEVHDAPTHHGSLSFAVRWHGDRPALLWELVRHDDDGGAPVRLTVPGLDPSWSTTEPRGDALLAPVPPPPEEPPDEVPADRITGAAAGTPVRLTKRAG